MSIIPITVYGDSILRKKTNKISQVNDEVIKNIQDMFETMRYADGIGLAANQVGLDKSLFVIDLSVIEGYEKFKPIVMINPEIIAESDEIVTIEEGCLSLPNLRADVDRPASVKVRFLNTDEQEEEFEADDFFARVIQHEYDHLIGKMIPDRVDDRLRKKIQKELNDISNRNVEINYPITEKQNLR